MGENPPTRANRPATILGLKVALVYNASFDAHYLQQVGYVFTLFVCLLAGLHKTIRPIFTKFGGKMANGPRKNPSDFDGNPADHVRVRVTVLGSKLRLSFHVIPGRTVLRLDEGRVIPRDTGYALAGDCLTSCRRAAATICPPPLSSPGGAKAPSAAEQTAT